MVCSLFHDGIKLGKIYIFDVHLLKLIMNKLFRFLILIFILLILNPSCRYFRKNSDTKKIFIVTSNTLNVRKHNNNESRILGKVYKGDTIFPIHDYYYWIQFIYKGDTAYVNAKYLKTASIPDLTRVSNMKLGKTATFLRDLLNRYVDWRTWKFWVIALVSVVLSYILIAIGKRLEDYIYYWGADMDTGYNKLPYIRHYPGRSFR